MQSGAILQWVHVEDEMSFFGETEQGMCDLLINPFNAEATFVQSSRTQSF